MTRRPVRVVVATLLLLGTVFLVSRAAIWNIRRGWDERIEQELGERVDALESRLAATQADLDTSLDELEERSYSPRSRAELFSVLAAVGTHEQGGLIVSNDRGDLLAWWGEYFPFDRCASYCYDTSNLYVASSREWTADELELRATAFRRIPLRPAWLIEDRWIQDAHLHGGALQRVEGSLRTRLTQGPVGSVWLDLVPEAVDSIITLIESASWTASSIILALAFILLALDFKETRTSRAAWIAVLMIAGARISLLGIRAPEDPLEIFGFAAYASRWLGPFARSPFDLLMTAAAVLLILITLSRSARSHWVVSGFFAGLASAGYVLFVRNLVENARISPIAEHILPETADRWKR
ncbi:MAG: hypothetical protein KY432_10595 [Acidobacteria bacterium]|nr:hypothetical protein [Acidobacteriota bacterium]